MLPLAKYIGTMLLFSRRNLFYSDYKWNTYAANDPRTNGGLDDTLFTKDRGDEVIYLINRLMMLWDYQFAHTGNKIEKLIHDKMPADVVTQEQVQHWVKANIKF